MGETFQGDHLADKMTFKWIDGSNRIELIGGELMEADGRLKGLEKGEKITLELKIKSD